MYDEARQRGRIYELLELARAYRGWNKSKLAEALDRDLANLQCDSGNPRFDYLVNLSRALDWDFDSLMKYIVGDDSPSLSSTAVGPLDFDSANAAARKAMDEGRYHDMLVLARRMQAVAKTPEERARGFNRESGAWDRLGRYRPALDATKNGLAEDPIPLNLRLLLEPGLFTSFMSVAAILARFAA